MTRERARKSGRERVGCSRRLRKGEIEREREKERERERERERGDVEHPITRRFERNTL